MALNRYVVTSMVTVAYPAAWSELVNGPVAVRSRPRPPCPGFAAPGQVPQPEDLGWISRWPAGVAVRGE